MINKIENMLPDEEREIRNALTQKTNEELKVIVNEEAIYGKKIIHAARQELTGRVTGTLRQKTIEEIRREEEEECRIAEERQRWAEE